MQDKNTPELPDHISTRTSGIFSIFHLPGLMGRWGAWIVLLAALLITFNAWYSAGGEAKKRTQARFDFRVKTIETGIYERLQTYEFLLRGGDGLFAASDEVTREEWRTYVTTLQVNQYYPGVQGVGFSKRILSSEKAAHIRQIRGEGFPQYSIKPDGDRPEYTSIIFLEPFDWRNQRAFGYDMFSEPTRKEAMIRARDTGTAALSGKVTLVQETDEDIQAGFLIYLAIYRKGELKETTEQRRKALMGYVYSPFRMNDFMKGVLVENKDYVKLQIFDGDKPLKETLLYHSDTAKESQNYSEGRHFATHQSILEYAGHRWLLSFVSSKYFEEGIETGLTNFSLLLGIISSLLLFGMVLSLTKSRNQAIALANTTLDLEKANIGLRKEITERKQVEEALKKSEELHKEAQHVAQIGHWELNSPSGTPVWSEGIFHILELDPKKSEPSFAAHVNIIHDEDWGLLDNSIQELSTNGTPFDIEFRIKRSNGETRWMHARGSAVKSEDGSVTRMFGTAQDITKRKSLEEELLRAQKLESVGLLAGGIAHDFNNILTTILGNVSLAKMQMTPTGETFEMLSEAEKASIRAKTLTKQLLTFAKGGAPVKEPASIKDILKESPSFVLRGSKSSCKLSIAEDLWPAEVDVGQISQVINNIVINANQAMPGGGIIQVAAENLIIEDRHGLPVNPGRYIKISIKDQGVGIAEKHLANIFDPYFTTRHAGSGLGLATTYSIIKKHNGHIAVESQLGVGTTFHIYLPASDKAIPEKEEIKLIKGHGRILVMDDEAPLRKMVGRMLGRLGYESEFAKDGSEAIRMVKDAKEAEKPYDAVILDLTIPGGMGGKEAINKLLEIDPEMKAIVSSGYSDDPVLANFQEYGFKGMMPKPFESRSLSKVLHEVLKGEKE